MNIRNTVFGAGILLLALAGAILLLDPSQVVTEPDPGFNVEVSSYVDGDAEFVYIPTTNETIDVLTSYNITVDEKVREAIENRRISNVSKNQPITVLVEAEPDQLVQVEMNITDLDGEVLHQSRHMIGPGDRN
jgi:hypothetical protein